MISPINVGPDAQLRELIIRILRSLFQADSRELQEAVLKQGLSDSERGSGAVKLLTGATVQNVAPKFTAIDTSMTARPRVVVGTPQMVAALTDSVKIIAKLSKTDPRVLANAVKRYQQTRPVINSFIKPKGGPAGWLGKLIQWGHVYQIQYFKWLYEHNQLSFDERYGSNQKRSAPNWLERQRTDMKGPMWAYVYAEPGYDPFVAPSTRTIDPNFKPTNWSQQKMNMRAPESVIYDYIKWTTGRGRAYRDWGLRHKNRESRNYGVNPVGDINRSLFDSAVVERVFSRSKYLNGRDPRWASILTAAESRRFSYWCKIARWLVWAGEIWRANDPERGLVNDIVERRWIEHTHKWGVGFVFPERLRERQLFGQNLETSESGKKAAARMNSQATVKFNTQKVLEAIMGHTPALMDLDNFRDKVFGSLCDWPPERTGTFAPSPRYPGITYPKEFSQNSGSSDWLAIIDHKVIRAHRHSVQQKLVRDVARGIVSVMSSELGSIASVYLEQLMAKAEGLVQDVIASALSSQLWATVSTPVGQISRVVETEVQKSIGNVWEQYDILRNRINEEEFVKATQITKRIKSQIEDTQEQFPWTGDLYGEIIPLPEESKKILRYF